MISRQDAEARIGQKVLGRDGSNLGRLKHVYVSRDGQQPTWGLVGGRSGSQRLVPLHNASADGPDELQVAVDRAHVRAAPSIDAGAELDPATEARLERHYANRGALTATRSRQREAYGGFKLGAAILGWIVATGLVTILAAVLGAIGTALGLSTALGQQAQQAAASTGIGSAIALLVVLLIGYYVGGYVAGRLARFDGARNGFGTWLIGVVVTVAVAIVAAIADSQYNVLQQVSLPNVPIDGSALAVGGLITLAAIVIGTLLAALLGGKAGERFHRKVDKAGFDT